MDWERPNVRLDEKVRGRGGVSKGELRVNWCI